MWMDQAQVAGAHQSARAPISLLLLVTFGSGCARQYYVTEHAMETAARLDPREWTRAVVPGVTREGVAVNLRVARLSTAPVAFAPGTLAASASRWNGLSVVGVAFAGIGLGLLVGLAADKNPAFFTAGVTAGPTLSVGGGLLALAGFLWRRERASVGPTERHALDDIRFAPAPTVPRPLPSE